MAWMAWTQPTALFFVVLGLALAVLTVAELRYPSELRRGWLPLATRRGDRFFIGLLISALIHVVFLSQTAWPALPIQWVSVGCLGITLVLLRWG